MRHPSYIAFTSCELPLSTGKKYVAVHLLTGQLFYFVIDVKGTGQELFEQVCDVLKVTDAKWFGLALLIDDDYHFIDQNIKLSKYAPKAWKSLHGSGVDSSGKSFLCLHFRVQFYVICHLLINDRVARQHYYLQLRENVTKYCLALSEERAFQLASYALQADLGNYHPNKHKGRYFEPLEYFPAWIVAKIGEDYIIQHAPAMHRDLAGVSKGEAHVFYIKESSDAAAPHNLHLYKLHRKKPKMNTVVWFGICFNGIKIYEENGCVTRKHLSTFLWSDIAKLYFDKKKFEIQSGGCPEPRKFTYYTHNEELAKNLLWLCRMTHQFNMFVQPQVQELQRRESEEDKPYRESYIYSNSLDLAWEKGQRKFCDERNALPCGVSLLKKAGSKTSEQRVSVISNASSTTTSGIVSDKVQSFDESEDDLDLEIIINTPPANQSSGDLIVSAVETHLSPQTNSHEHQTSLSSVLADSGCSSCTGQSSTEEERSGVQSSFCKCASLSKDNFSFSSYPTSSFSLLNQEYRPGAVCVTDSASSRSGTNCISVVNNSEKCITSEDLNPIAPSVCSKGSLKEDKPNKEKCIVQSLVMSSHDQLSASKQLENGNFSGSQQNKVTLHVEGQYKIPFYSGNHSVETKQIEHTTSLPPTSYVDVNSSKVFQNSTCNQSVSFPHYHGRTATRIGVSSLTRVQRLPLTLFGRQSGIGVAGSEPNLSIVTTNPNAFLNYNESRLSSLPFTITNDKDVILSKLSNNLEKNRPESGDNFKCENGIDRKENLIPISSRLADGVPQNLSSSKSTLPVLSSLACKNSIPNESILQLSKNSISFQPYDVHKQASEDSLRVTGNLEYTSRMRLGSLPVLPTSSMPVCEANGAANSLDLQQLRQKSQDMDLPLISALCNDRSLLMLPKTVPTCSRQRHMGTNKDMRRFSYTYMNSGSASYGLSSLYGASSIQDSVCSVQTSPLNRPISWHVDSSQHPWKASCDCNGEKSTHSINESGNLIKDSRDIHNVDKTTSSLASTILTSFSKLSDRRTQGGSKDGYSGHLAACGGSPKQMIPVKLSSAVMR